MAESSKDKTPALTAPAVSTGSGLLLEPPLDLSGFTREKFVELSSSIDPEKIHKPWTSPVVALPSQRKPEACQPLAGG